MALNEKTIFVYENWTASPKLLGRLYVSYARGKELFSFEYDSEWLSDMGNHIFMLDPDISFYQGRQFVPLEKALFGLFEDSCPDRWGRMLMQRRENIRG